MTHETVSEAQRSEREGEVREAADGIQACVRIVPGASYAAAEHEADQ